MSEVLAIVTPVFGIVFLGFGAAKLGWFSDQATKGLSQFVFDFAIPVLLWRSLAEAGLPAVIEWEFLISYYGGVALVFGLGVLGAWLLFRAPAPAYGIHGMACAFSNTVLLGIPLVLTTFGPDGALPLFLMLAFHGLTLFTLTTLTIEIGHGVQHGGGNGRWATVAGVARSAVVGLMRNPIVGGLAAGLLFALFGWSIPEGIDGAAELIGQAATPCALFAMGASISRYRLAGEIAPTVWFSVVKLIVHPLLVYGLAAHVFALDPLWVGVAVLIAAMPVGVNVYLFAQRYGQAEAPAAASVLLSTLASAATVTAVFGLLDLV